MKNRKEIRNKILKVEAKITELQKYRKNLIKLDYMTCDKKQWYIEDIVTRGRGKNRVTKTYGKIHWNESFFDEDTKKSISVERSRIVSINGEFLIDDLGSVVM